MQLIVWLLFACNMGFAAGVIYWKHNLHRVQLAPPQRLAGMELSLPAGWMTTSGQRGATRYVISAEQQNRGLGRTLRVRRGQVPPGTTASQVLDEQVDTEEEAEVSDAGPMHFGIGEGVFVELTLPARRGVPAASRTSLTAAAVTPEGEAIIIEFSGADDPSGRHLVEAVAASLKLIERVPTPVPGDDAI